MENNDIVIKEVCESCFGLGLITGTEIQNLCNKTSLKKKFGYGFIFGTAFGLSWAIILLYYNYKHRDKNDSF